jgi:basic membrane protein A
MDMKKVLSVLLILCLALSLVGCSSGDNATGASDDEDHLKVAMVLPTSINDAGWSAAAYEGLLMIEEQYDAEITYNENTAVSDYDEVFRLYASNGYDVVFAHGAQYADAVLRIAPEYPDVQFCLTSCTFTQDPNVSSIHNQNGQQGFLEGVVAAVVSKSDIIGIIGGMDIPSISNSVVGFEAGAKYINPDIEVLMTYTGDFEDAGKVKEIAMAMIDEGADVLTHNAGGAGNALFEALKEGDIYGLGSIADQSILAPDHVITSGIVDLPTSFLAFMEMYQSDDFQSGTFGMGVEDGIIYLAPFYGFEEILSTEQIDTIADVESMMHAGELDIQDYGDFKEF